MKNILFFTPYAGRTGSEMFLWYMFSHFDRTKLKASLVSECDGELLDQMPDDVKTFVSLKYPNKTMRLKQFLARGSKRSLYNEDILRIHKETNAQYWYLNTILMADKISIAKANSIPVIAHFHELTWDYGLVTSQLLNETIDYATLCIGDSEAVCEKLRILGAKNVALQYECIDTDKIVVQESERARMKSELGLSRYDFIWVMSGTSTVRKGMDMLPALARHLKSQNSALLWMGNNSDSGMDLMVQRELSYDGCNNVFFLGKKTTGYYDYMNLMDGFVLTSREEPFGMVVVEAMALGKPVVAFNAGGVAEIVTPETGRIVDSWNVKDLAQAMQETAIEKNHFSYDALRQRAMKFDVTNQVKNWENILTGIEK